MKQQKPEVNIEAKSRRGVSFSTLSNDFDELAVINEYGFLFSLRTDFDIREYNLIFEKFKEVEYPIMLEDGIPIIFNGDVVRDRTDIETLQHNNRIAKYRTIALIRLMAKNLELPDDDDVAVDILDSMGSSLNYLLQEKIREAVIQKLTTVKERKELTAREILAYSNEEKMWLTKMQHEKGIKVPDAVDNRRVEYGVSSEYIYLELAEKYNWSVDFQIRVFKGDLTEDEECLVALQKAKYQLDVERENRIHKEMESKSGR